MSVHGTSPVKHRPRRSRTEIEALDRGLCEIVGEHASITVRGVFYRAVAAGLVPKDEARGYRAVQRRLLGLREARVVPYEDITDNVRVVRRRNRYGSPEDYARYAAEFYRRDYWRESPARVEVWLEKDALAGVLEPVVVGECGLELFVTRGYASVTYLQNAADSMAGDGRPTYIYLLTDFDPSGLGIAETVSAELARRSGPVKVHVERLAVTREQIGAYELPTRPTKHTDARASKFTEEQGTGSVDLDALPPDVLRALVRESIERHIEPGRLDVLRLAEEQERDVLREAFGGVM